MYFPLLRVSGTRDCIPDLVQNERGTKKTGSPFLCGTVCRVGSLPEDSESDYFSVSCQLVSRIRRMISSGTEPSVRTEIQLFLFM